MEFEWNPIKAEMNLDKHGVSFREAATVFDDPLSITFPDADHSINECRYIIIGISRFRRILAVAHTDRGKKIRIISARQVTHKEKRFYEEGN